MSKKIFAGLVTVVFLALSFSSPAFAGEKEITSALNGKNCRGQQIGINTFNCFDPEKCNSGMFVKFYAGKDGKLLAAVWWWQGMKAYTGWKDLSPRHMQTVNHDAPVKFLGGNKISLTNYTNNAFWELWLGSDLLPRSGRMYRTDRTEANRVEQTIPELLCSDTPP